MPPSPPEGPSLCRHSPPPAGWPVPSWIRSGPEPGTLSSRCISPWWLQRDTHTHTHTHTQKKEKHTNNQCVKRVHSGGVVSRWIINCAPLLSVVTRERHAGVAACIHKHGHTAFVGTPPRALSSLGSTATDFLIDCRCRSISTMN